MVDETLDEDGFEDDLEEEWHTEPLDPEFAKGEAIAQYYLQDAKALLASAKLEPDWLVPYAIPSGAVTFIVGKPGSSKSWLGYDLVCAVTQDRPWLNLGTPVGRNATALVLNFDNPGSECARRFLRLGLQPQDRALFHSLGAHRPPEPLPQILQLPGAFEPLDSMVYAFRPDIILVDSLRQAHTSDESSSQEMAQVMSQLRRFAAYGAAVVVIHHTRKGDGEMRGSTEIEAAADAIIDVANGVATWRKTRGWEMPESTAIFTLVDEGDSTEVRGGQSLARLLEAGPLDRTSIGNELGLKQQAIKSMVDKALEKGLCIEVRGPNGGRLIGLARRG